MHRPSHFPLFQSHLDLAHTYWKNLLKPGDRAIDATCGNGQDTLVLCRLLSENPKGDVWAIDIQAKAIELTRSYLSQHLEPEALEQVHFQHGCHSRFPEEISQDSIALIIYNLGYLPGNDKNLTTLTETTLQSLRNALTLLKPGGAICITCYPGHTEGAVEESAIIDFATGLSPFQWNCCHHKWLNRKKSPSLLLLQRSLNLGFTRHI